MLSIPTVLINEKNKLYTPNPWLVLLDIVLDDDHKLYFVSNNENITFDGQEYTAFPFNLDPTSQSTEGTIPTVSLQVCNVTQIIQGYLEDLDGAVGAKVTIRVVNANYLEADYADLEMTFSVLASSADAEWITFTLGAENPLRRRFPVARFIATHCNWEFKGVECAYAGAETTCSRTFDACSALVNTRRFGGYVGLSQKGWKAV